LFWDYSFKHLYCCAAVGVTARVLQGFACVKLWDLPDRLGIQSPYFQPEVSIEYLNGGFRWGKVTVRSGGGGWGWLADFLYPLRKSTEPQARTRGLERWLIVYVTEGDHISPTLDNPNQEGASKVWNHLGLIMIRSLSWSFILQLPFLVGTLDDSAWSWSLISFISTKLLQSVGIFILIEMLNNFFHASICCRSTDFRNLQRFINQMGLPCYHHNEISSASSFVTEVCLVFSYGVIPSSYSQHEGCKTLTVSVYGFVRELSELIQSFYWKDYLRIQ
jgi:hypothetical protein